MKHNRNDWSQNVQSWVRLIDENLDPFRKYVLDPFLERVVGGRLRGLCLDVGCGEGTTSRLLQRKGCDMIAVDYELGFLKVATKRSKRISYVQADATFLPFRECIFDGVICKLLSPSLADYDLLIGELRRVMRAKATFFEIVPHPCFATFRGSNDDPNGYLRLHATKIRWHCEGETNLKPVTNFHRPLQHYVACFQKHNLKMVGLWEPQIPSKFLRRPEWADAGFTGPPFLILETVAA